MIYRSGDQVSRRGLLETLLAAGSVSLLATSSVDAQAASATPRPFRVSIPQATVDRILRRVSETRWPDRLETNDWSYGANWDYMKSLAEYWTSRFDWRKAEANLNRYPQFLARVGDFDIHFYHVRGRGPKPVPLILTHGWPGSVLEFLEAIGPLTDPARFGGSPDDAFDVVVPSVPGFGSSSKPKDKPVGLATTAALWNRLMTEVLGYAKYGAQGGDVGNGVTNQLAHVYADSLLGIHFNGVGVPPPPEAEQTEEERGAHRERLRRRREGLLQRAAAQAGDRRLRAHGQSAGHSRVDRRKAQALERFSREPIFPKDQVLTNIMIYLVTDTIGTSAWFYRGRVDEPSHLQGKASVPTGFASFPRELPTLNPPRTVIERNFNLLHYTRMPRGGHFACWEQPSLLVEDLRQFFRKVRS
jgi:pimeloyl-ACP methyl ester carboxylesterase